MLLICVCPSSLSYTQQEGTHLHNSKTQNKIGGLVGKKGSVGEDCELARYIIYMYGFVKNVSIMHFINI